MQHTIPFTALDAAPWLAQLRTRSPLVHCITNDVVQNFTANVLLASGAVPAMVVAQEEVEAFVAVSQSLLINVGTLTLPLTSAIELAVQTAHNKQIPWVLDPVAIGAVLAFRTEFVTKMVNYAPTVIRGNPSEILSLANQNSQAKGPDGMDSVEVALPMAIKLAKKLKTIITITGEIDYITNGQITYSIHMGTEKLTKVTGAGCSLSALVAAFIGCAQENERLEATAAACFMMANAGSHASNAQGMGSFAVSLLDNLSLMSPESLRK